MIFGSSFLQNILDKLEFLSNEQRTRLEETIVELLNDNSTIQNYEKNLTNILDYLELFSIFRKQAYERLQSKLNYIYRRLPTHAELLGSLYRDVSGSQISGEQREVTLKDFIEWLAKDDLDIDTIYQYSPNILKLRNARKLQEQSDYLLNKLLDELKNVSSDTEFAQLFGRNKQRQIDSIYRKLLAQINQMLEQKGIKVSSLNEFNQTWKNFLNSNEKSGILLSYLLARRYLVFSLIFGELVTISITGLVNLYLIYLLRGTTKDVSGNLKSLFVNSLRSKLDRLNFKPSEVNKIVNVLAKYYTRHAFRIYNLFSDVRKADKQNARVYASIYSRAFLNQLKSNLIADFDNRFTKTLLETYDEITRHNKDSMREDNALAGLITDSLIRYIGTAIFETKQDMVRYLLADSNNLKFRLPNGEIVLIDSNLLVEIIQTIVDKARNSISQEDGNTYLPSIIDLKKRVESDRGEQLKKQKLINTLQQNEFLLSIESTVSRRIFGFARENRISPVNILTSCSSKAFDQYEEQQVRQISRKMVDGEYDTEVQGLLEALRQSFSEYDKQFPEAQDLYDSISLIFEYRKTEVSSDKSDTEDRSNKKEVQSQFNVKLGFAREPVLDRMAYRCRNVALLSATIPQRLMLLFMTNVEPTRINNISPASSNNEIFDTIRKQLQSIYGMPIEELAKRYKLKSSGIQLSNNHNREYPNFVASKSIGYSYKHYPTIFDYDKQLQTYVCLECSRVDYRNNTWLDVLIKRVSDLHLRNVDKILILTTSYSDLRAIEEQLKELLTKRRLIGKVKLLVQRNSASASQLIKEFINAERAILIGTEAFWKGVSVEGEKTVLITRLPYPSPDPNIDKRRAILTFKLLASNPKNLINLKPYRIGQYQYQAFLLLDTEIMLQRIRQGMGRAIRTKTDRAWLDIYDNRILRFLF